LELLAQSIADFSAQYRIADDNGHDVAWIVEVWDAGTIEPAASGAARSRNWRRSTELVFRWQILASAAAATAGGSALVKIKPDAKLRTKSHNAAEPAI
jgi:hypothetical protein